MNSSDVKKYGSWVLVGFLVVLVCGFLRHRAGPVKKSSVQTVYRNSPSISVLNQRPSHSLQELDKTMQVYIMTKNEWPLIKSTVLYHGSLFGFRNIYIIDASTDPVILSFLRTANEQLGVHVINSTSDLNTLNDELNAIMQREKRYADFMIKLDTDEIVVYYNETTSKMSTDPLVIRRYLNTLPSDGARLKSGFITDAVVFPNCSATDNSFIVSRHFNPFRKNRSKTFFLTKSFGLYDLGGHIGAVFPPYDNTVEHITELSLVHYHFHCFERAIHNTEQAVFSHKYVLPSDTLQQKIDKLHNLTWDFPAVCRVASCHKAYEYKMYLKNPDEMKKNYYPAKEVYDDPSRTQPNPELSDRMIELEAKYYWVV